MTRQFSTNNGRYEVSDDKSRIDIVLIHDFLANQSYWAQKRPLETVRKSIENSYCMACYDSTDQLTAFARVITDWATAYYICDLFVFPRWRGQGIGKHLVQFIAEQPDLAPLTGMLLTADAHGLYKKIGFVQDEQTRQRFMMKRRPQ